MQIASRFGHLEVLRKVLCCTVPRLTCDRRWFFGQYSPVRGFRGNGGRGRKEKACCSHGGGIR